jgi:hypothetical protein
MSILSCANSLLSLQSKARISASNQASLYIQTVSLENEEQCAFAETSQLDSCSPILEVANRSVKVGPANLLRKEKWEPT